MQAKGVWEPDGKRREKHRHQKGDKHDDDKGENGLRNPLEGEVCNVGNHIKVDGNRRRDLADRNVKGHHDSKPDGAPSKMFQDRNNYLTSSSIR